MSEMPIITQDVIRARVGDQSYARGASYFRTGAIFGGRRQGLTLKAHCRGSSAHAYRVEATLGPEGIEDADCSCPVGGGGGCKHIAALLLTWNDRPESFVEVEGLDVALERRSKEELIALIHHMLRRSPELESLLETPLPVAGRKSGPVDPELYRGQAQGILGGIGHEWGEAEGAADELTAIREIADQFARNEECLSAIGIYRVLCEELFEHFDFEDENGSLGSVVTACAAGVAACLKQPRSGVEERLAALDALFEVYRFDTDYGGIGLSDDTYGVLTEQTTSEERRYLAEKVRTLLSSSDRVRNKWQQNAYGGFLLRLEGETLDDEGFLQICRETGRLREMTERLLTLGRLEEAVAATDAAGDYELLSLADLIEAHGHGDAAETLVRKRSESSSDTRLLEWLKQRALTRGDHETAIAITRRLYTTRPSLEGYRELRALADALGRWESLRPRLRERAEQEPHSSLLLHIYLDDGEIDPAIEIVRSAKRFSAGYASSWAASESVAIAVARAAEETRPHAALEIYRREVENLLRQRAREYYRVACRHLRQMEAIYRRLGEGETWDRYLRELQEQNRSLRAFKEELASAGLTV